MILSAPPTVHDDRAMMDVDSRGSSDVDCSSFLDNMKKGRTAAVNDGGGSGLLLSSSSDEDDNALFVSGKTMGSTAEKDSSSTFDGSALGTVDSSSFGDWSPSTSSVHPASSSSWSSSWSGSFFQEQKRLHRPQLPPIEKRQVPTTNDSLGRRRRLTVKTAGTTASFFLQSPIRFFSKLMMMLMMTMMTIMMNSSAVSVSASSNDFDQYQLNGGLVAAVAGRNFCIVASDTRMAGEGGYLLASRNHIANRLWSAAGGGTANSDGATSAMAAPLLGEDLEDWLRDQDRRESGGAATASGENSDTVILPPPPPPPESRASQSITSSMSSSMSLPPPLPPPRRRLPQTVVVIGSSGCSTDCCQLRLDFQADYRAATALGQMKASHNSHQVANLLSQTLYGRRRFPYYAFCVVGGLDQADHDASRMTGKAFVYDAIGSFEQVAVAVSGTGRELLQPILDRMFATTTTSTTRTAADASSSSSSLSSSSESSPTSRHAPTTAAVATATTRATTLRPSIRNRPLLQVDCSADEAVDILCKAYRSVSEREIGVGDKLILHVSEATTTAEGSGGGGEGGFAGISCRTIVVPLKRH